MVGGELGSIDYERHVAHAHRVTSQLLEHVLDDQQSALDLGLRGGDYFSDEALASVPFVNTRQIAQLWNEMLTLTCLQ